MAQSPDEKTYVEIPFIEQLKGMDWDHIEGDIDVPYLTERDSFRDVLLTGRLRKAIKKINLDDAGIKSGRSSKAAPLRLWHGYFELVETEKANARNHFVSWYRKQIKKRLKERIPRYNKRIGVKVKDVRILDLSHRWASCGKNGSINFNWRSVMAPVWVFDYILVHEMVHMIERGHTDRFWSLVARVMPDYEEYARWLNENGGDLDL